LDSNGQSQAIERDDVARKGRKKELGDQNDKGKHLGLEPELMVLQKVTICVQKEQQPAFLPSTGWVDASSEAAFVST
jgi:hypothetical protein